MIVLHRMTAFVRELPCTTAEKATDQGACTYISNCSLYREANYKRKEVICIVKQDGSIVLNRTPHAFQ